MCSCVTYIGHVVGQGQIKPVDVKISVISGFPRPETKKQLMRFLGMADYYNKFCLSFSAVAEPLTELLGKKVKFSRNDGCEKAFEELKAILQNAPVLSTPNFDSQFKLAVDASDFAAGTVLLQEDNDVIEWSILSVTFLRSLANDKENTPQIKKNV